MTQKNVLLPLILASLFFTAVNSALAAPAGDMESLEQQGTRNEALGFFGGALVGGLVAGPPGVIVAASIGLLTTSHASESNEREFLAANLRQTETELIALQGQQRELQSRYQAALQEIETGNLQRVSLNNQVSELEDNLACCSDTALSLHFQTNSVSIEPHYMQGLEELVQLAEELDNPMILISGYADPRGTAQENQRLSELRVDAVVSALQSLGIPRDVIQTSAFGESRPLSQGENPEAYFFDRRVNIELRSRNNELFTLSN